jgi:hypothetical protein
VTSAGRSGGEGLPVAGEAADPRRGGGQHARDIRPVEEAVLDDRGVHDGEGGLEPDHAVRGRVPLALLGLDRVGCVVGRDDVDGAVGERGAERVDVLAARRSGGFTLKRWVVARDELLGEQQVVGVTSAVTSNPRAFAHRMTSTDPAVETWQTCRRLPTCSASSTSRAMIDSSATAGQPVRPSSPETAPSFIWAPTVRRGSCACWAMTPSKDFTYSRARRMSTGSQTQKPSSEKTRTRARDDAIAPSSASCSPARPTVTAPIGWTVAYPACSPSESSCSTTPAVSATGDVLPWQKRR